MTTILFCEDDVVIQRLIQVATRSLPYTVHVVGDGAQGLATIERERPAAVFTDLAMPGFDGLQLIDALHARPDLADVPVVVMTASGLLASDLEDLLRRGAVDYLAKPFGPAELRAKLDQVLAPLGT
jgi:two-component system chemotaxis response regulator CheY